MIRRFFAWIHAGIFSGSSPQRHVWNADCRYFHDKRPAVVKTKRKMPSSICGTESFSLQVSWASLIKMKHSFLLIQNSSTWSEMKHGDGWPPSCCSFSEEVLLSAELPLRLCRDQPQQRKHSMSRTFSQTLNPPNRWIPIQIKIKTIFLA